MAPPKKVLAAQPGDVSSIPRTHIKEEGKNQLHIVVSTHALWHTHLPACIVHTCNNNNNK